MIKKNSLSNITDIVQTLQGAHRTYTQLLDCTVVAQLSRLIGVLSL